MSREALGWGTALVALGVALLLRALGMVADEVAAWPWAALAAGAVLGADDLLRRRRASWVTLALLAVGALFALREVGVLPTVPLLPLVVIVVGGALLLGGLTGRGPAGQAFGVELADASRLRLQIGFGAGRVRLRSGAGEGTAVEGRLGGGGQSTERRDGDRLDVALRAGAELPVLRRPRDWDVAVTTDVEVALELRCGACDVDLDLRDLAVTELLIRTGASDIDVTLPARGRCRVEVDAGAADIVLRVPDGVAAAVTSRASLASLEVDERRFPRVDGTHRSPDHAEAVDRVDIVLDGGVASFAVR